MFFSSTKLIDANPTYWLKREISLYEVKTQTKHYKNKTIKIYKSQPKYK